ncbi:MAG: LapA family protein [Dokdonella sp.]|uniref:LapA family protein n=1 Tax=Dokdonella sp. TaxID=2291710 RepID=UPI00326573FE
MRFASILMILTVVAGGALFGALNDARVVVDFQFWQWEVPIGAALLVALSIGWLLGGIVAWVGESRRLRRDLRGARANIRALETSGVTGGRGADG